MALHISSNTNVSALTVSGMTLGSVLFAGTGGLVSQDNSKFFYNATSHLLAVGVQTPFSALHVASTLASAGVLARFTTGDYADGTTGSGMLFGTGANSGNTYSTIGAFSAGFSATNKLILNNVGGNVGIGNTVAPATLSVGGTAATAQSFNTFTDVSNYELAYMGDWGVTANVATYGTGKAGTGSTRNIQFVVGGVQTFLSTATYSLLKSTSADTNAVPLRLLSGTNLGTTGQSVELAFYESTNAAQVGSVRSQAIDATNIGLVLKSFKSSALTTVADYGVTNANVWTFSQASLFATSVALTNGAAAATGTLTNAPTAGNPTKWVPINDNGTTRYIPAW